MKLTWKEILAIFVLGVLAAIIVGGMIFLPKTQVGKPSTKDIASSPSIDQGTDQMKLTSPVFEDNQPIPAKYTCDGENISPPLSINEVSENTQSLALIVDDPDAPGGTFTHWLAWNIATTEGTEITEVTEGTVPSGVIQGKNDFGKNEWGGPCPPSGTHRYFFKLYALDQKLDMPTTSNKGDLEKAIQGHILSQAQLVGLYSRNR